MAHLTMYDVRDLDLMLKLRDEQNDLGELTAEELADALGMSADTRAVAMRLAWMRRYGMLTFNAERRGWSLSKGGERVVASKLKAAQADRIEALDDGQMIDVMAHVTTRYRYGDPLIATLLRREFAYGTSPMRAQQNGRGRRRR